jgi:hypothetical protein
MPSELSLWIRPLCVERGDLAKLPSEMHLPRREDLCLRTRLREYRSNLDPRRLRLHSEPTVQGAPGAEVRSGQVAAGLAVAWPIARGRIDYPIRVRRFDREGCKSSTVVG